MGEENKDIAQPLVTTIKEGSKEKKQETQVKVIRPEQKRVCRCSACGQFLFEIVTDWAFVRTRCRRTECKMINIVTIENGSVSYSIEEKEPTVKY